jgi:hypothetical protein
MAEKYIVKQSIEWTYLDNQSKPIKGFRVTVYLTKFDETHYVYVPDQNPVTVKAAIEQLVSDREALAAL